jgi:hypothetical protein
MVHFESSLGAAGLRRRPRLALVAIASVLLASCAVASEDPADADEAIGERWFSPVEVGLYDADDGSLGIKNTIQAQWLEYDGPSGWISGAVLRDGQAVKVEDRYGALKGIYPGPAGGTVEIRTSNDDELTLRVHAPMAKRTYDVTAARAVVWKFQSTYDLDSELGGCRLMVSRRRGRYELSFAAPQNCRLWGWGR